MLEESALTMENNKISPIFTQRDIEVLKGHFLWRKHICGHQGYKEDMTLVSANRVVHAGEADLPLFLDCSHDII